MSKTDPSSWVPDFQPGQFVVESHFLLGVLLGTVAYGVHVTLFFITLSLLWARSRTNWRDYIWIAYIVVVFVIGSIGNAAQFKVTQDTWIKHRDYPGGPSAYTIEQSTVPLNLCNCAYIVNGWFQDGVILYRFWIIYGRKLRVFLAPATVFLGEIGISIALIIGLTAGKEIRSPVVAQLFTSYFSITISLNILLTLLIVGKLMSVRRRIRSHAADFSETYISVSAMLIESSALYAICALIFLIPWVRKSTVDQLMLPALGQVESIAPLMILMRVAQGRAWSSDTETRLNTTTTSVAFNRGRSGTQAIALSPVASKSTNATRFNRSAWSRDEEEEGVKVDQEVLRVED